MGHHFPIMIVRKNPEETGNQSNKASDEDEQHWRSGEIKKNT